MQSQALVMIPGSESKNTAGHVHLSESVPGSEGISFEDGALKPGVRYIGTDQLLLLAKQVVSMLYFVDEPATTMTTAMSSRLLILRFIELAWSK